MTGAGHTSVRNSVTVLSVFAFVWAVAGISGLSDRPNGGTWAATAASLGVSTLLIRRAPAHPGDARSWARPPSRTFTMVVIVEFVTIVATVAALIALDASAFVPGAVVLVVGVHFLALARVLDTPLYDRTGGWLCVVALIALGVATLDGPASQACAGLGVAVVLWATAWLLGGDPSGDIEPRNVETPS